MKKFLILSAAAVSLMSMPAMAQEAAPAGGDAPPPHGDMPPPGAHGAHMFEKLDANGDGVITKDEFLGEAEKRFSEADADSDGKVTKEEFQAKMRMRMQDMKAKREHMKEMKGKAGDGAPEGEGDGAE